MPAGTAICNITAASAAVTLIRFTTNMFHNIFFSMLARHKIISPCLHDSLPFGAFDYFFERRQSIIPSIIFHRVIYYLHIDLSVRVASVLSLLTSHLGPTAPLSSISWFFLPRYLSYRANRIATLLFLFRSGTCQQFSWLLSLFR